MLPLGLIGLGPQWQCLYKPALQRLRPRLGIRAVFTPIASQALGCCQEWECELQESLAALVDYHEVQAIVILDSSWFGSVPVEFACRLAKPVLVADSPGSLIPDLLEVASLVEETSTTVVPDLLHRHSPATTRLRELLAAGDEAGARRIVHTLKGLAATLGAQSLHQVAVSCEQWLQSGQPASSVDPVQRVEAVLAQFRQCLDQNSLGLGDGQFGSRARVTSSNRASRRVRDRQKCR